MSLINTDWDYAKLEELIEARGSYVIHETGVACTCRNQDTFASMIERDGMPASLRRLNCYLCAGDGYIYRNARVIKGLISGVSSGPSRSLINVGYAVPGDAVFSPSFNAGNLTDFDKITFLFPEPLHEGQVILRNAANMSDNKLVRTDLSSSEDRLWYSPAAAIWCEDENGIIYTHGTDFVFDDKKVQWVENTPDDGTLYVLKYEGYHEWLVYHTPLDRFDRDRDLSPRVLIRKKHVMFTNGSLADTPAKRVDEQDELTTRTKI